MSKNVSPFGDCKLCGAQSVLQESHIVSKFLIRQAGLLGAGFSLICHTNPKLTEHNRQDGIKEYLLCLSCEKRLGKWETYTAWQIYGKNGLLRNLRNERYVWQGLNYAKLKLFLVSMLWRMSISVHYLYSGVELGAKHEQIIRSMLLTENPLEPWNYGVSLTYLHLRKNKPFVGGFFTQPRRYHSGFKSSSYRFVLNNFALDFDVSSHRPTQDVEQEYLQASGTWDVNVMEVRDIPWIKEEIALALSTY